MAGNNEKPIDYIICEGPSDAEFVSLYIEKAFSYSEDRIKSSSFRSSISNSKFCYLVGTKRDVLVCSSGGCRNISTIYNGVVLPKIMSEGTNTRVIIIVDRDNKNDSECCALLPTSNINFVINSWTDGAINGQFVSNNVYNQIHYRSYFSVIPNSSFGAFENVLITAISHSEPAIANEVINFINFLSPQAKTHISTNRKEIKAKLDSMIVLIDPERIHTTLKQMFDVVNLNDTSIQSNYSFLNELLADF